MAHELGHLIFFVNRLRLELEAGENFSDKFFSYSNKNRPKETAEDIFNKELFSWLFAYNLIKTKSDEYKKKKIYQEFQCEDPALQDSIINLTNNDQRLNEALRKAFKSGHSH